MSLLVFFAFFVTFMEKIPLIIKFYGVFDHFSRTCYVAKFWTTKLYLYVSDVIHANEQKKYANCDLRVIFWNFLQISLCFVMTKDHFKQKLLLWPHVPFKNFLNTTKSYIQIHSSSFFLSSTANLVIHLKL